LAGRFGRLAHGLPSVDTLESHLQQQQAHILESIHRLVQTCMLYVYVAYIWYTQTYTDMYAICIC
jgi:hypothetical protein